MTGRPWYAFYPDAYERDAGTLSYVRDSGYRRMLDHYYKTGNPLPLDKEEIYRACRAMRREERLAIDANLDAFFSKEPDGYHQGKADDELHRASEISAKRSEAASKRHSKSTAIASSNAEQLDTHLHSTSTATPSEAKASSVSCVQKPAKPSKSEPGGFAEFYSAFPLHKARPAAAKAYANALTRAPAEALLDGARRYAAVRATEDPKFTKHPATWLNNDCWLDEDVSRETEHSKRSTAKPSALDNVVAGIALALGEVGGTDDGSASSQEPHAGPVVSGENGTGSPLLDFKPEAEPARTNTEGMGEPLRASGPELPASSSKSRTDLAEIPSFLRRPTRDTCAVNSRGLRALSQGAEPGREAEVLSPSVADTSHV